MFHADNILEQVDNREYVSYRERIRLCRYQDPNPQPHGFYHFGYVHKFSSILYVEFVMDAFFNMIQKEQKRVVRSLSKIKY